LGHRAPGATFDGLAGGIDPIRQHILDAACRQNNDQNHLGEPRLRAQSLQDWKE